MNAAHVALFLSFSGHGGVERMVANLAGGLARRGLRVDLVLARTDGGHAGSWPEGVRVVALSDGLLSRRTAIAEREVRTATQPLRSPRERG